VQVATLGAISEVATIPYVLAAILISRSAVIRIAAIVVTRVGGGVGRRGIGALLLRRRIDCGRGGVVAVLVLLLALAAAGMYQGILLLEKVLKKHLGVSK
jgi:hypothetical protein